jgi:hypothetical protein
MALLKQIGAAGILMWERLAAAIGLRRHPLVLPS